MSTLALHGGNPVRTDPWPIWPQSGEAEKVNLLSVLESGVWGGYSDLVQEFEAAFAKLHEVKHCIAVANGTTSLEAALRVLSVEAGDEVIVPPYTFIATANAPKLAGATPVFVDVEPDTYNLDIAAVEAAITPRTKAIIPVHFAGHPVDMDALMPLAEKHGIGIVEDAAHAHGTTWRGRPVGGIGHVGSFSLQESKNLTAGEGGILITNDDDLAEKLWSFANQGRAIDGKWYEHEMLGSNLRITGWQAAILMGQLERFDEQLNRRMENARRLRAILSEVDGLAPMRWDERCEKHAHHLLMMRYDEKRFAGVKRDLFVQALNAEGINCSTGYAYPLYHQPPLNAEHAIIHECPVAERACKEVIWLTQNMLLAEPEGMEQIGEAILKVREGVDSLRGRA
ncbi:MAG: DegT/DnrJ/EryC1/StrS family aminotransferase [Chloroflexota bacterium]